MPKITLYMAPGTCARVTAIALLELGLEFDTQVVRFMKAEHRSQAYLNINPLGKVPAMVYDGEVVTENVAIIQFLNSTHGALLPTADSELTQAHILADLCFCSSTLHPTVTRIRMPQMFAGMEHASAVKAAGMKAMDPHFQVIENRLAKGIWWYADQWSAVDAYLFWVFWRVEGAGYDVSRYPNYCKHYQAMLDRPSVLKAFKLEADLDAMLEREGLRFTPPKIN